jgi:thioredoxin reductase (NADPH)
MNETTGFGGLVMIDDDADGSDAGQAQAIATGGGRGPADGADGRHAKVLIIGSGPAGLTAAIYAARADLAPIVIAGVTPGGQLMITSDVENYPGFPEGIDGPTLMARMREQAVRFGSRVLDTDVEGVDLSERPFRVTASGTTYTADALIIATGASAIWLGLESESALRGRGVSACATCDGFFFRDAKVAVIGGGDSALEEALFLTRFASEVVLIHRRDSLRASRIMQNRAFDHPRVSFRWDTEVIEVLGADRITGLRLRNVRTGEETTEAFGGMFVAIGHQPNTSVFRDWLPVDGKGYLVVHDRTRTPIEGVFVAGDVHDHRYRQAVTAAGDGCMAAIDAERWLEEQADLARSGDAAAVLAAGA